MLRILQALLFFIPAISFSQTFTKIEEKTKGLKKYEGYFNYYWDEKDGKVWLEIPRIDSEFLYVNTMPAGIGSNDLGLDRGVIRGSRVVKFNKSGPKLLLIEPNQNFRAVTGSVTEKHAVELAFAQSTLWGFSIVAESNGHFLVDATDFILRDALRIGNELNEKKQGRYEYSPSRSALYLPQCKNFPLNTELEATITLVLAGGSAGNSLSSVTPSEEAVTFRIHFSFIQLPDANYKPRVADPRSSFIERQYFDYSTPVYEPINKHFINRFRLEKKDPSAIKSEAVKPIIYYLDNGTPEPIRTALLEGGKWWNQAFEAAGYMDAFQVQILPDDADPMDIRYNMINWVHRSTRGWSYGVFVEDPRTGEIIKGNVTLGSLRVRQDYLIATGLLTPFENGLPADNKMLSMALARLRQLSAHEIGHTIGLQHNYSASTVHNSSVMDYPHPMVSINAAGNIDISKAYPEGIGDWDKVSIAYGYQDFPKATDEKKALDKILADAYTSGLQFISDGDARPAGSLHPTAHLWDNGSDIVDELNNVIKIRRKALENFSEKNIRPGRPMAELEEVLVPIYLFHRYQVEAVTKLVGSMYYSYALRGDGQPVTKAVSKAEQQRALNAVISTIDPGFLNIPEKILQLIPPRPSGYEPTRELFKKKTGLVLDALSPAETAADMPISFLLNEERINRLVEQEAKNAGLSLAEMISQLVNATWKAKRKTGVEGLIQIQTEQILLTYLLARSVDPDVSFVAQGVLMQQIEQLKKYIIGQQKLNIDSTYGGHLLLALARIAHPEKATPTVIPTIPPGSPIGCDE